MRYNGRLTGLAWLVMCVGCSSRPTTFAVQGEVSYEGRAVEWGQIDFVPIENTPGASAVAPIKDGRYAVEPRWGLRPDGGYLVRIVAFRKTGRKEPNRIERGGPPLDVTENFIPPTYNTQSTLKLRVSDLPDKNKADFHLGRSGAAAHSDPS